MSDWNDGVIAEFRANGGKVGGYFEGAPMILLHHIGARSGTVRVTPLVYFPQDDGSMLVVASKGGAPTNPDWYHNVLANPRFEVEVGTETFTVDARGARAPTSAPSAGRASWPSAPASATTRPRRPGSCRCCGCAASPDRARLTERRPQRRGTRVPQMARIRLLRGLCSTSASPSSSSSGGRYMPTRPR